MSRVAYSFWAACCDSNPSYALSRVESMISDLSDTTLLANVSGYDILALKRNALYTKILQTI
ncbi:hypothetical protein LTR49_022699, partial [Elasticomyces elasticus]